MVDEVVCQICCKKVTKRKSLSLEVLGGGTGRACRTHLEVQALVAEARESGRQQRFDERLQILTLAAQVRFAVRLLGMAPIDCYRQMEEHKIPFTLIEGTKREVRMRSELTPEELQGVLTDLAIASIFRE